MILVQPIRKTKGPPCRDTLGLGVVGVCSQVLDIHSNTELGNQVSFCLLSCCYLLFVCRFSVKVFMRLAFLQFLGCFWQPLRLPPRGVVRFLCWHVLSFGTLFTRN